MIKTCSVCGDPVGSRNRSGVCRRCRQKVYRDKNRCHINAQKKIHYEANKESINDMAKVYREDHKEELKAKAKVYQTENKDMIAARAKIRREVTKETRSLYDKVYYEAHKEANQSQQKDYYEAHKRDISDRGKIYRMKNKERILMRNRVYKHANPDKVREWRHERRKYLSAYSDCEKLNHWFPGCNAHHITPCVMIHIPSQMHNAVYHSLRTGQGMDEINRMAFDWLHGVRADSPQTTLTAFG